jgi:hypothetical protein
LVYSSSFMPWRASTSTRSVKCLSNVGSAYALRVTAAPRATQPDTPWRPLT